MTDMCRFGSDASHHLCPEKTEVCCKSRPGEENIMRFKLRARIVGIFRVPAVLGGVGGSLLPLLPSGLLVHLVQGAVRLQGPQLQL